MALWGNTDAALSAPRYTPAQKKQEANTTTVAAMFGNTSSGVFAADEDETKANPGIAHAGWQLRTEGSGGRAGRVHYETLVAMSSITTDAADDAALTDNLITITTAPVARTVTGPTATTFVVAAAIDPAGTLVYQWQTNAGGTYANVVNGAVFTGATTNTLAISSSAGLNGVRYRVIVSEAAGNANPVTTTGVVLTVE